MNRQAINRFIYEKVEKKCWHEWLPVGLSGDKHLKYYHACSCGKSAFKSNSEQPFNKTPGESWKSCKNPDYFSDDQYLPFLRRCQKEEWWREFLYFKLPIRYSTDTVSFVLSPDQMLPKIAEWHGMVL